MKKCSTHPMLHPPLELVCKIPVCEDCGLPVQWFDMGNGIIIHLCIDFDCPGRKQAREQIEEEKLNRRVLFWGWVMMPIILPALPVLAIAFFFLQCGFLVEKIYRAMDEVKDA